MKSSMEKSPGWLRGVQIGLGIITVILAIYALAFPAVTFLAVIVILAIILFIVGIEKIITGIFLPVKGRWATIGFGILVLIFAGLAISFPEATALVVTVFVGIGLIFNGCARIVEGIFWKTFWLGKVFPNWCRNIVNNNRSCCSRVSSVRSSVYWNYYSNWAIDNRNSNDSSRRCG